jgi:hypothetical protein
MFKSATRSTTKTAGIFAGAIVVMRSMFGRKSIA